MRYIGSKNSTIDYIMNVVSDKVSHGSFCDPFGGIGIVGAHFKKRGFKVTSGDILTFPHYFQVSRIVLNSQPKFKKLFHAYNLKNINELEILLNKEIINHGWFIENYSVKRKFFTIENAYHIEGARMLINEWERNGYLKFKEKAYLLASLINSMDKVANTAGTYYAYLKYWHRKALRPFQFQFIPITYGNVSCDATKSNAFELVKEKKFDVLYLDPPYNERNYARYYHLPESIALQREFTVNGKSGMPNREFVSSDFNSHVKALNGLLNIVSNTSFKYLLFHYTDNGIINREEIVKLFQKCGTLEEFIIQNKNGYTTSKGKAEFTQKLYLLSNV